MGEREKKKEDYYSNTKRRPRGRTQKISKLFGEPTNEGLSRFNDSFYFEKI